jgi:hypothetical protein
MKFLLYIVGLRRSSGAKSGEFLYSPKHDKFIYQGRELEMDEFNTLMEKQWPMQRMANQQVSGFAFVPSETESDEPAKPNFFEFPIDAGNPVTTDEPAIEIPVDDEGLIDGDEQPADETPETEEPSTLSIEAPKPRTKKTK